MLSQCGWGKEATVDHRMPGADGLSCLKGVFLWPSILYNWRSERSEWSHSQFMSIEICGICRFSTYVQSIPEAVAMWRLQSKRSRVRFPHWNFFFSLLFFMSLFFSVSFFSPFFFLQARSAISMLKHFSSITLSLRWPTTVHSNDTLVDTSFQLISDFFHANQGV